MTEKTLKERIEALSEGSISYINWKELLKTHVLVKRSTLETMASFSCERPLHGRGQLPCSAYKYAQGCCNSCRAARWARQELGEAKIRELEDRIERQRATVGWARNAFTDEDVIRGEAELARLKGLLQELEKEGAGQ